MLKSLVTLGEFLDKKIFRIPNYQRNYSWEKEQLIDLWDDLNFLKKGKRHYFGTILIKDIEKTKKVSDLQAYNIYEVIDGQQRLTTISIFLNEILKEMGDTDIKKEDIDELKKLYLKFNNIYLLELLNEDKDFFRNFIIDDKTYPENLIVASRKRLKNAKEFFNQKLNEKKNELDKEKFKFFLLEILEKIKSLEIIQYAVKDESDAILIFQTVNDRGIPLSKLEKTKSFLMHMAYLSNPEDFSPYLEKLNTIFSNIFKDIENIKNTEYGKILDQLNIEEESIQRYHYIFFKDYRKDIYSAYFKNFKENITNLYRKDDPKLIQTIMNYAEDLECAFSALKEISTYKESDEIKELLDRIFYLGRIANFLPILITFWINIKEKDFIKKLLQIIEIFSFRVYGIGKRRSYTAESALYKLAHQFNKKILEVVSLFEQILDTILRYEGDSNFKKNLDNDFYGRISRKDINYLLFEYEKQLRIDSGEPFKIKIDQYNSEDFEIEHIWAQRPRNLDEDQEDIHKDIVNKIGNLTIASEGWNKKWQNSSFEEKVPDYEGSILRMQRNLSRYKEWNVSSIELRNDLLKEFCLERWNVSELKKKKGIS